MKYENANNVLPPELIRQIQKYAAGKLLYIPQKEEPVAWGSLSGARQKLQKRNQRIYDEYKNGKGVGELEEEWLRTYYVKTYGEKSYPEEWICDGLINMPLRLIEEIDDEMQQTENLPLMIRFQNKRFCCQGTKTFLEELKEKRMTAYPAYIFVTDKQEYAFYEANYGRHFHRIQFKS